MDVREASNSRLYRYTYKSRYDQCIVQLEANTSSSFRDKTTEDRQSCQNGHDDAEDEDMSRPAALKRQGHSRLVCCLLTSHPVRRASATEGNVAGCRLLKTKTRLQGQSSYLVAQIKTWKASSPQVCSERLISQRGRRRHDSLFYATTLNRPPHRRYHDCMIALM